MLIRLSKPNRLRTQLSRGFTLAEMMISLALGMIILGSFIAATMTLSHSLVAVSNYVELDSNSRNTLDILSRDIRNSAEDIAISSTAISMSGSDVQGNPYTFTYNWDGSNFWRTYVNSSGTNVSLMLSNCTYLCFSNFTHAPSTNFTFNVATGTNDTKLISVSWKCTRSILGQKLNTESVQTAKICVRN